MESRTMSTERGIRVAFSHFYPGFSPHDFWIPLMAEASGTPIRLTSVRRADVVCTSVYESFLEVWRRRILSRGTSPRVPTPPASSSESARHIWISGENLRVPAWPYDLSISFDLDSYGLSNIYWPYLMENLNWEMGRKSGVGPPVNSRGVPLPSPISVARPRQSAVSQRKGFVCAFVGNPEPVRMRALKELEKYGDVAVFGSAVGRPVSSKLELASKFKFVLAFENDLYPGYVTEKPLEAYACGAIPLWRGIDSAKLLNPESVVNAADFECLADFAKYVSDLAQEGSRLDQMGREPLLLKEPSLAPLKSALRSVLLI